MNNELSNSSSCIRPRLGPRIFGHLPESFAKPEWCYENCCVLAGWMQGPDSKVFYTPFATIIYLDYQGRPDVNKAFQNQALFDVSSIYLCCTILIKA
jgi:hypothetical protein